MNRAVLSAAQIAKTALNTTSHASVEEDHPSGLVGFLVPSRFLALKRLPNVLLWCHVFGTHLQRDGTQSELDGFATKDDEKHSGFRRAEDVYRRGGVGVHALPW